MGGLNRVTVLQGGDLCCPELLPKQDLLLIGGRIARIETVDIAALEAAGFEVEVISARGCWVTPGIIDPHEHLLGGSGEKGFATQTPEIFLTELAAAGITTVVG